MCVHVLLAFPPPATRAKSPPLPKKRQTSITGSKYPITDSRFRKDYSEHGTSNQFYWALSYSRTYILSHSLSFIPRFTQSNRSNRMRHCVYSKGTPTCQRQAGVGCGGNKKILSNELLHTVRVRVSYGAWFYFMKGAPVRVWMVDISSSFEGVAKQIAGGKRGVEG